jgi:hypothetical protein
MSRIPHYEFDGYEEIRFKMDVDEALKAVRRVLDVDRNPRLAEDVGHVYTDKYVLANTLTNTAIVAYMNILERIGLTKDILQKVDKSKTTTIRFAASQSCQFLKEVSVDVPLPVSIKETEKTDTTGSFDGSTTKSTIKEVVNRVEEFHWNVGLKWEFSIYSGTNVEDRQVLMERSSSTVLITQSKHAPYPEEHDISPKELSLMWLLKQIDTDKMMVHFAIDLQDKETKTPLRNKQVDGATDFVIDFAEWMSDIGTYIEDAHERGLKRRHNPAKPSPSDPVVGTSKSLSDVKNIPVFIPVLPLMEEDQVSNTQSHEDVSSEAPPQSVLSVQSSFLDDDSGAQPAKNLTKMDVTRLLNEQMRTLDEAQKSIQDSYPENQTKKPVSIAEATVCLLFDHSGHLSDILVKSLFYVEKMLRNQLIAAIGKEVNSEDLDNFLKYHNTKMLRPVPRPFCHAIRRPEHFPEGVLTIESNQQKPVPIETHVREVKGLPSLKLPLNAATTIELKGNTYFHGWLNHQFLDSSGGFQLSGRARQFSSFMLVIGTMTSGDRLQPKDAIILQNKDEVNIPLLLNEIPSAKEFRDAIDSLSPEQQRFAKAYRSMQLEGSVLGIAVIQIKPQLEELLGLPHDALTKEMKLTQDLMKLFIEYQVPADLLSYDGENGEATAKEKVENVKEHVQAVLTVIDDSKKKQLEEQAMKADMAVEQRFASSSMPTPFGSFPAPFRSNRRLADSDMMKSCGIQMAYMSASAVPPAFEMEDSITNMLQNTEKSDGLAVYSETLNEQAAKFKKKSKNLSSGSNQRHLTELGGQVDRLKSTSLNVSEDIQDQSNVMESMELGFQRENEKEMNNKKEDNLSTGAGSISVENSLDFTAIPKILDGVIEKHDKDSALRSTTIKTGERWTRCRQENLLTKFQTTTLIEETIKSEKDKAFDLLDALSRSGSLPIQYSDLHVIVCVTHRFEKNVMETVIQDNINPIEKLEMSTLLLASTIHGVSAEKLICDSNDRQRLATSFPTLLGDGSEEEEITL